MGASKQLWEEQQEMLRGDTTRQRYLEHKHFDKPKDMADTNIGDINEAFNSAINGEADPVSVAIAIRSVKDEAEDLLERLRPTLEAALANYPKRAAEMQGWRVSATQGAAEYKYDHIPAIKKLEDQLKELKEKAKIAAQLVDKGMAVGTADGEEIIPAIKTYKKDSIKFEAPKGK